MKKDSDMNHIVKRPKVWSAALFGCCLCLVAAIIFPSFTEGLESFYDYFEEEEFPEPVQNSKILVINTQNKTDVVLETYRNPEYQELVEEFFEEIAGSAEIAALILHYSSVYDVSPSLAFSLCWEESRFHYRAVNRANRNGTIDRGLFQLNSATFPNLTERDFFDLETNIRLGVSHLSWCLGHAGTEVSGLAMYNAGSGRVRSGETPKVTLDYASRILARQRRTDDLFKIEFRTILEPPEVIVEEVEEEEERKKITLSLLRPLGRH